MFNVQVNTALCDEVNEGLLQGLVSKFSSISLPLSEVFRKLETVFSGTHSRGMLLC